jgi:hypothetical protein
MNSYAGKVRIGAIAIFCAVALAIVGLHRLSGRAYSADPTPTLFVTDDCSDAVTAYAAASSGDVPPLAPVPTGLSVPSSIAIDASGNIYVANACTNTITIYAKGSNGNATPTATIGGATLACRNQTASRWIPAATSMWRTTVPRACLSIRRWEAAPGC